MIWAEISDFPERERFGELSKALAEAGFANEVSFVETSVENFADAFEKAQREFTQLRIGGSLGHVASQSTIRMPSPMLSLRSADSFVQTSADGRPLRSDGANDGADDGGAKSWWPRNYICNGLQRLVVNANRNLDTTGAVMILGATSEARAIVASFVKAGFSRFSISDPDDRRGLAFIKDMERFYFTSRFQFVSRNMITQLPSVHSVAVNALAPGRDDGVTGELFYFNFLKPGGLWLDFPFRANAGLASEAVAVGARVEPGYRVAAWTDQEWARDVLGVDLDSEALVKRYEAAAPAV